MSQLPAVVTSVALATIPSVVDICQSPDQATLVGNVVKAGAAFFAQVWTEVRQSNPDAKANKIDPGLALAIAQTAAMKASVVHPLWKELLRTALDPDRPLTVTKDDVDLLNSMDPFQVLLVDTIYRHSDALTADVFRQPTFIGLNYPEKERLENLMTYNLVMRYINLEHGLAPVVDLGDFGYLIQSRLNVRVKETGRQPIFQMLGRASERAWDGNNNEQLLDWKGVPRISEDTIISLRLMYPAIRLAAKMTAPPPK